MKQNKILFFWKKNQNGRLKKTEIFNFAISWAISAKISWIGSWVSRIEWCEGHWSGSTYMAVRLSDTSSKMAKKDQKSIFWLFLSLCRTASWPHRLSHINALGINLFKLHKDYFLKVSKKSRIVGAGKWHFFVFCFWLLGFSLIWSKKKIKMGDLKKSKWQPQKKPHFPAAPILNIFSWNFHGLVLGLVGLIDGKGIDSAQPIWPWSCLT